MELIFYLFIFISGYYLGQAVTYLRIQTNFKRICKENGIDLEKIIDEESIIEKPTYKEMKVEEIEEMLYLYDKNANFICQGKTLEDLVKFAKDYKNISRGTIEHNNKIFLVVDGNVKEYKSNEY